MGIRHMITHVCPAVRQTNVSPKTVRGMDTSRQLHNFGGCNTAWYFSRCISSQPTRPRNVIFWIPKRASESNPNKIPPDPRIRQAPRRNSEVQSRLAKAPPPSPRCDDRTRHGHTIVVPKSQSTYHSSGAR